MNELTLLNILLSIIGGGVLIAVSLIIGLFSKVNKIDVKMNVHIAETDTKYKYIDKEVEKIGQEILILKTKRA